MHIKQTCANNLTFSTIVKMFIRNEIFSVLFLLHLWNFEEERKCSGFRVINAL